MYDLIVIGAGPGGYLCAQRAAEAGFRVCLFEEKELGGVCLNEGCIPTKTLLYSSKLYRRTLGSENFGVTTTGVSYDHQSVINRKNKVVDTLVRGVGNKLSSLKVDIVYDSAVITGRQNNVFFVEADGEVFSSGRLCIATGSETIIPPIPGLQEALARGHAVTNREILDMQKLPESLAVIGGGIIGLEMAFYFSSVGVNVSLFEMLDRPAASMDTDVSRALLAECGKRGITVHLSCRVTEISENKLFFEDTKGTGTLPCDLILLSAGRRPRTTGLGLETLGIETDHGLIVTDKHLCTNMTNVYAVGDCNGKLMLAHTAYREAEVAVNHMLGYKDEIRYENIPTVAYTDPEAASVGLTLEEALNRGFRAKSVKTPLQYSGRFIAETENSSGFCKIVVDTANNRLLGLQIIGPYSSEIILAAELMLDTELSPERLKKLVFPHPSIGEVIRESIFRI